MSANSEQTALIHELLETVTTVISYRISITLFYAVFLLLFSFRLINIPPCNKSNYTTESKLTKQCHLLHFFFHYETKQHLKNTLAPCSCSDYKF